MKETEPLVIPSPLLFIQAMVRWVRFVRRVVVPGTRGQGRS